MLIKYRHFAVIHPLNCLSFRPDDILYAIFLIQDYMDGQSFVHNGPKGQEVFDKVIVIAQTLQQVFAQLDFTNLIHNGYYELSLI